MFSLLHSNKSISTYISIKYMSYCFDRRARRHARISMIHEEIRKEHEAYGKEVILRPLPPWDVSYLFSHEDGSMFEPYPTAAVRRPTNLKTGSQKPSRQLYRTAREARNAMLTRTEDGKQIGTVSREVTVSRAADRKTQNTKRNNSSPRLFLYISEEEARLALDDPVPSVRRNSMQSYLILHASLVVDCLRKRYGMYVNHDRPEWCAPEYPYGACLGREEGRRFVTFCESFQWEPQWSEDDPASVNKARVVRIVNEFCRQLVDRHRTVNKKVNSIQLARLLREERKERRDAMGMEWRGGEERGGKAGETRTTRIEHPYSKDGYLEY